MVAPFSEKDSLAVGTEALIFIKVRARVSPAKSQSGQVNASYLANIGGRERSITTYR
jgi:hypothetical protein